MNVICLSPSCVVVSPFRARSNSQKLLSITSLHFLQSLRDSVSIPPVVHMEDSDTRVSILLIPYWVFGMLVARLDFGEVCQ